ncbi:MAG: hypothetical protein HY657_07460 [Acidobacteria bacterium]|nr:hypothetical protein [Acidobacteriota bacterium]
MNTLPPSSFLLPPDDEPEVAALLRAEREAACEEAHPPAAGVVWWRAERRRREEAARAAARPIAVVHALTVACAAGVAAALVQFLAPFVRQGLGAAAGLTRVFEWDIATLTTPPAIALGLLALAWLVLAPLLLFVALSDD